MHFDGFSRAEFSSHKQTKTPSASPTTHRTFSSAIHAAKCLSYDAPHYPLTTRSSTSPTTYHIYFKIASTTSFAEPKLSELVPTLIGESNFASWSTALKYALDTKDPRLFDILTSKIAQPASDDPAFTEWLRYSRHLLSYLHATIHASLKPYINTALDAPAAYQSLFKTFAVHTYNIGFDKFHNLRPSVDNPSEQVLISIFSDFVISKNRRLASYPNFNSDPVFYDANAVHKPTSKDAKPKHFCTFHQRKTAHTSEEYFRNPANANNANNAKLANAVSTPASSTTKTTANQPITANTVTGNPTFRYNNLFAT
ncbi:uncharacterized protein N7479_000311 [Penicillium vulpinum]|uniref:uncharacterized protein n=1 Tax=Penicillium vulpinum TaxID=29845 RepID=UPI0025494926|nr:uncharacterized protein N7479_000311 [Penicillium vulpinum]KAJ5970393.1 hypothetical protein N7479_000311 [Penicillium vulpinum]